MRSRKVTDTERLDNLKTLLALCEFNEKHMKSVNDYYHENGTVQGCPGVTPDAAEIIDKGIAAGEYPDGQPFSAHDVLHEYYEAQRLRREIEELEGRMYKFVGWTFAGGEAGINTEKSRLQLKFYEGVSTIKQITLRQHGFSWSVVDKVWERRLSRDAIHAAASIKFVRPLSGVSPEKLQPYVQEKRGREGR